MAKVVLDDAAELVKEQFFRGKDCAYCGSTDMLELDRVDPLLFQSVEIWSWGEFARHKHIKNECQVLCSECFLRKKRLWKKYREENATWYQEFVKNG